MQRKLTLVSFDLCPYVQRAAIALNEKGVPFERVNIDLDNKPDWFLNISPRGKVPVLQVGDDVLFESAAIAEYLDEVHAPRLHPEDPIARARHRAWMEFGSAVLMDNWTIVTTTDQAVFDATVKAVKEKLKRVEAELGDGPYFAGEAFSIVDAVFAPALRYCDLFERVADLGLFEGLPKVASWREALAARASVREGIAADYDERLAAFMRKKGGILARLDKVAA